MTQLPFVLLVLIGIPGGNQVAMETTQQFSSPLSCSMRAFIENEQVKDRTYVCVTRDRAEMMLTNQRTIQIGAADELPAK
jgi:hypothetical protein